MKLILGGHWNSAPAGWQALDERQQDITKRLNFSDNSVDVIYTEHVIEHITFEQALFFMRESLRVLKPGGIFRVVAPMVDQLIKYKNDELGLQYANFCILPRFTRENELLNQLGLCINTDPLPFVLHSLLKFHGHQFVWSSSLMAKTVEKIGFSKVNATIPGKSIFDESSAIERVIRGLGTVPEGLTYYDPESLVVEAIK